MSAEGSQLDAQVRGVEANNEMGIGEDECRNLEVLLAEAVRLLTQAENEVITRKQKVAELEERLADALNKNQMKVPAVHNKDASAMPTDVDKEDVNDNASNDAIKENVEKEIVPEAPVPQSEASNESVVKRKAEVRRKWRVLGMKVRVGVTANIVRRRKINDASTFVDKETESVTKEDNLDLEGKCERKTVVKKRWRKAGILVGNMQGRDAAF